MKYVITGGPGCGKTSVLDCLKSLGYEVVPEGARQIIEEQQRQSKPILWNTDFLEFEKLIIERQFELEAKISKFPAFTDRGLPDSFAYCIQYNVQLPKHTMQKILNHKYTEIFILDPLPREHYANDNARWESKDQADQIHKNIENTYKRLGYETHNIPVMPIQERARFIIDAVKGGL